MDPWIDVRGSTIEWGLMNETEKLRIISRERYSIRDYGSVAMRSSATYGSLVARPE